MSRKTLVKLKSIKSGATKKAAKTTKKKATKKRVVKRATTSKPKTPTLFSDKMLNTPDKFSRIEGVIFIFGLFLSFLGGFLFETGFTPELLFALIIGGLLVGLINVRNIRGSETQKFLFVVISLVILSMFSGNVLSAVEKIGPFLNMMFQSMIVYLTPMAIIISLKIIYEISED